ncbi:Response regulator receiver domain-containing protein [Dyella sp. OK004]|nr:Response regulator receiver domain-containing protein [Dyella sp. OK004]
MNLRIVIADDHRAVLLGARIVMERAGITVVGQSDNADDLERTLSEHKCDVLLTDYEMPSKKFRGGLDMLISIRRHFPALPIVVATGMLPNAFPVALLSIGVLGFVHKTAPCCAWVAAVQQVASGRIYTSAPM